MIAPFGPVLDIVAKLSSTKSFCWLEGNSMVTSGKSKRPEEVGVTSIIYITAVAESLITSFSPSSPLAPKCFPPPKEHFSPVEPSKQASPLR